jgi:glycosyltransferase involved in cell wall biosynthesis
MRLLMVDQYGQIGGGQRCFLEAAEGFRAKGWDVYAAVPPNGPLTREMERHCTRVYSLPCGPFTSTRKSLWDALRLTGQLPRQVAILRRIAREHRIDAIYVNGSQVLPAAALAYGGLPVLFHVHWVVTQRLAVNIAQWAVRRCGAFVIATSEFVARSAGQVVGPDRIRVVYNGVTAGDGAPRGIGVPRHIAIVGRVAPEKGQLEFVRAARLALRDAPWLRFTVCGAPMFSGMTYMQQVRQEAKGLPIEFPGWMDDIPAWLSEVDLLVVPSQESDNIPRVILEAFAAQVPVIAYPSGGIPELIENEVTGLLVRERTPEALARGICSAIEAPELLTSIATEARRRWERQYSLERFQSDVCDIVEEVVRLHHQRTPPLSAGSKAEA